MSPRAVRTWYKYRYLRCLASSRVSRGLELERCRCPACRRRGGRLWSKRQAVMNSCTITLIIAATGQAHNSTPPQHGGGVGSGVMLVNYIQKYVDFLLRLWAFICIIFIYPFDCFQTVHEEINGRNDHGRANNAGRNDRYEFGTNQSDDSEYDGSTAHRNHYFSFLCTIKKIL